MKWIILVVLLFPEAYKGDDGVLITHNAEKELYFESFEDCVRHVNYADHSEKLYKYAMSIYKDNEVKPIQGRNILCIPQKKDINI
tara:strand:+ start:390 stop:644 length:255 start_codon:yes stop_codon:yes gene_type:complete